MLLEALVTVVVAAVRMVVSMLWRSILMHLLRAGAKLIWSAVPAHRHYFTLTRRTPNIQRTYFVQVVVEGTSVQHIEALGSCRDSYHT